MRHLSDAIRSCPLWITAISWGSLGILLIKVTVLDRIDAPLPILADLSPVTTDLLTATFAAYLFFLFSVQIPLVQNKEQLGPVIDAKLSTIAHAGTGFLTMLAYAHKRQLPKPITRAIVAELFSQTDPNAASLMVGPLPGLQTLNWLQAMARHFDLVRPAIARTLRHGRYLDSELFRLLSDIEDSPITDSLNETLTLMAAGTKLTNTSLAPWADNFWDRLELEQRLSEYRTRLAHNHAMG